MSSSAEKLWNEQNRLVGDRLGLFRAVEAVAPAERVLYPGSYVDIAPSFVYPDVTYVDTDRRAARFFSEADQVAVIVERSGGSPSARIEFVHRDYTEPLPLDAGGFDLLISLYGGFVSAHCTEYLRVGGTLLVNSSHGDAAMASIDERYVLAGAVTGRGGTHRVRSDGLDEYLVPKKPIELTPELLRSTGRGVAYTKPAFAYLFRRVA